MSENFSLGGLRKKVDLSQLKGGLKAEQFDFGKKDKLKSVFDKIDANNDGTISADELEEYIDLLESAAGADKTLSRKEAKMADLGSRKDINKILKQAFELSKNIKPEQTPDTLPTTPVAEEGVPNVEQPQPNVEEEPINTDETPETQELTPQDALKNLFGDKRKASVKIDGSSTGLSRAYQGEVRLPNGETLEDGKFPENLRMTLPAEYGENATMKLKLIDPENGIYETSAKDRNFQIVTDEDGNVTIKSVNVDELQGKLDANLAEYARIQAEREAAQEAAPAGADEGGKVQPLTPEQIAGADEGGEVQSLTPEQIAEAKAKQRNAGIVADELYNALQGGKFNAVSSKEFQNSLKKVTSENASAVLSQYNTKHPDESLVRMICNEKTSDDGVRKNSLKTVMAQLAAEAKAKGVPAEEVDRLVKDFNASADEEFGGWLNVIDSTVMDNTMKRLLGLTQGVQLKAGEISATEAKDAVTGAAQTEYETARESFDAARKEEGWFAKRGDDLLGLLGCTTRGDMDAKLGKYKGDIEKLQNCKTEAEFQTAYKEIFGIPYDGKKVAAYQAAYSDYVVAYGAKENSEKMQTLFNEARGLNYDAYKTKVMSAMNMSADEVDALVDGLSEEYMAQHPHSDKKDVLRHWVDTQKQNSIQQFDQIAKGRTLEQINQDVDSVRQAAFGTNDIVNDVIKYNANQEITGMATEIGAEIVVTAALAAIPGGQGFAAARIAANAAKWGSRGVKLARYMPKAANLAGKAASTVKNSKVVRTAAGAANTIKGSKPARLVANTANRVKNATPVNVRTSAARIARSSDAAFEGTLAVNLIDGKSVEDSVKKALQNAAFAGAGATSAELAPFIAKAMGCSGKVAEEICEQALDVASSAGISYGVTGGYTSDDALVDVITGVAMNRLGKIGHGKKADAPAASNTPEPKILDRSTANNSAQPGGKLGNKKFEQVKQEVIEELAAGTTPKRAAQLHNEADKLQIQSRQQGREIKHIVEDATGVYDSPSLGKIDLANETDISRLQKAKQEISQWLDGKKDIRGDAARNKQALLDKINARIGELNAQPELQGQKVKSEVVEEMNALTEKDAASVLANAGKPLSPHGAAILDDKIKLMTSVDELEAMKKQLESRVGYQVQGVDHAQATIKKLDAKIANVKAHQADFAATTQLLDSALSAGKGLSSDDLNTIRTFAEKCNSADELKQLVDKMKSSKAIKSFGGSKKLINEINAKIEVLNTKNLAQVEMKADTPETPAVAEQPVQNSDTPDAGSVKPEPQNNTNVKVPDNFKDSKYFSQSEIEKFANSTENDPWDIAADLQTKGFIPTEANVLRPGDPHAFISYHNPQTGELYTYAYNENGTLNHKSLTKVDVNADGSFTRKSDLTVSYDSKGGTSVTLKEGKLNAQENLANLSAPKGSNDIVPLQDKTFVSTEKLTPEQITKFLRNNNIEYKDGLILKGNGTVAFDRNGINYQLSYEDGKLSALRLHDRNGGNKYYYSYDAAGNRTPISRDNFIKKFESSNMKHDKAIEEINNDTPAVVQLTSEQRLAMGQISNNIKRAQVSADLQKAQAWLDKMPDCSQKTHLQKQLDEKLSTLKQK